MDGATDFEAVVSVESKATTNFLESGTKEIGTNSRTTLDVSTYLETNADIKSFMSKPYLLNAGQWTTANAVNQNLAYGDIATYLTSVPIWAEKVKGFNLIRGDFMIKVELNASPFQQGKLLLHYLPAFLNFSAVNTKYGNFKNKQLVQKVQHPHVEVDCRKTTVVMRIPYVAPTPWYSMKEGYYDWGRWQLDVFSALFTGAAAPANEGFVDFAVYGWWENIELNGATLPQSSSKTVKRRGGEVSESAENSGPITQGLRKVSKAANVLSEIPLISEFVKPVEWVTNILGNFTSVFGWSKPRELEGQTNVYQQQFRYAGTCDGPDTAFPGGISSLNRLEAIDYGSYTNEDEMSLEYLYSVPYYGGEFTWAATAGTGTSLFSKTMSPLSFLTTGADTVAAHTTNFEYHVPFTYLARMHKYWRGNLNLTLKFIKTQMHSGRIQVTWIPCNNVTTTPTLYTSSYAKRIIIDVRTEDTITLELPYLIYSDYLPTVTTGTVNIYSGQVDIQVLNDLRSPESCAQDIKVQWFVSPGKDFELAVPGQVSSGCVPYEPQSDGTEVLRDSVEQGMTMDKLEIGGTNTKSDALFHCRRCIGEKILSIKSLLLRNSVINKSSLTSFTFSTGSSILIDPYFIGCHNMHNVTGIQRSSPFVGDLMSMIAPWYAFMRGGVRYLYVTADGTSTPNISNCLPVTGFFTTNPYNQSVTAKVNIMQSANLAGSTGVYPLVSGNYQEQLSTNALTYQHIPYYSKLPMMMVTYYNGTDTPINDPGRPASALYMRNVSNLSPDAMFSRAVTDDFQLMFFTGCPCLATAYA